MIGSLVLPQGNASCAAEPHAAAAASEMSFRLVPGFTLAGEEADRHYRDPSNIIKVGSTYYLWFNRYSSAPPAHGYDGTIWYATSSNLVHWQLRGEALGPGEPGTWDAHCAISPYVVSDGGTFYMFYTAIAGPFDRKTTRTGLGLATSDSPNGPWKRIPASNILKPGQDGAWDDFRVDGTVVMKGPDQRWWLFYKGTRNPPTGSRNLGVAFADQLTGPWQKHQQNPILDHTADFEGMVFFRRGTGLNLLADSFGSYDMMHFKSDNWLAWQPATPFTPLDLNRDIGSSYKLAAPGDYVSPEGDLFMVVHGIWSESSPNIRLRLLKRTQ